jgi:predicted LPLAT superfamily acyltransferase
MSGATAQWQNRPEAGSNAGMKFLIWIARHLGRKVLHALLAPVSIYFYSTRGPERRASYAYLSRVLGRPARAVEVMSHFRRFSNVTADRFYFLAGRADAIPVRFVIDPQLEQVLQNGNPGIVLAAHLGSFEAARVLGPALGDVSLRIVLDLSVNERFMEILAEIGPELADRIIDSEQSSVALGLSIRDALQAGDWVGFLADRSRAGDRTSQQTFLGSSALFPTGPYIIANLFKSPILGVFCRLTEEGYEVHCEVLSTRTDIPRKHRQEAIDALVGKYVERLEHHVRASPYAWFNFFDFWEKV